MHRWAFESDPGLPVKARGLAHTFRVIFGGGTTHRVSKRVRYRQPGGLACVSAGSVGVADSIARAVNAHFEPTAANRFDIAAVELVLGIALVCLGLLLSRPRGAAVVFGVAMPGRQVEEWQQGAFEAARRKYRHIYRVVRPEERFAESLRAVSDLVVSSTSEGLSELRVYANCTSAQGVLLGKHLARIPSEDLVLQQESGADAARLLATGVRLEQQGNGTGAFYEFCKMAELRQQYGDRLRAASPDQSPFDAADQAGEQKWSPDSAWTIYRRRVSDGLGAVGSNRVVLLLRYTQSVVERSAEGAAARFLQGNGGGELLLVVHCSDVFGEGRPGEMTSGVSLAALCLDHTWSPATPATRSFFASDLPLSASTALGALARPTVIALDYVRGVDGAPAQYRPLLP